AKVQAHWHFMGRRYGIYVAGIQVGNACPPGGGVGGSIGGHGETAIDFVTNVSLVQSPTSGGIDYVVSLVSPDIARMTISVGFQYIGDLGIPMNFNLPVGKLSSGQFSMLFFQEGSLALPNGDMKKYAASLNPKGIRFDKAGVTATW